MARSGLRDLESISRLFGLSTLFTYSLRPEADVAGRPLSHAAACSHSARRPRGPTSHGTPYCPASSVCDRRPLWYETGGVYA